MVGAVTPPRYIYNARVLEVVNGQQIQLRVDLGFKKLLEAVFSLDRITVPTDLATPKGTAAKTQLEKWIAGRQVIIQCANRPGYPAEVWIPCDPVSVNEKMVAAHHATRA